MKNNNDLKRPDEIQADLEDPNKKHPLAIDGIKSGKIKQGGLMHTPPDEQQYEKEPEPPQTPDFTD